MKKKLMLLDIIPPQDVIECNPSTMYCNDQNIYTVVTAPLSLKKINNNIITAFFENLKPTQVG